MGWPEDIAWKLLYSRSEVLLWASSVKLLVDAFTLLLLETAVDSLGVLQAPEHNYVAHELQGEERGGFGCSRNEQFAPDAPEEKKCGQKSLRMQICSSIASKVGMRGRVYPGQRE